MYHDRRFQEKLHHGLKLLSIPFLVFFCDCSDIECGFGFILTEGFPFYYSYLVCSSVLVEK